LVSVFLKRNQHRIFQKTRVMNSPIYSMHMGLI